MSPLSAILTPVAGISVESLMCFNLAFSAAFISDCDADTAAAAAAADDDDT